MDDCAGSAGPGAWMTPSVSNSQGNEYTRDRGEAGQERATLTGQSQQWQTPTVQDGRRQGNFGRGEGSPTFAGQARQWPTPTASLVNDGEDPATWNARRDKVKAQGINGNGMGMPLTQAAQQWPTPDVSSDYRDMTKVDQAAQRGAQTKVSIGLPTVAVDWPTPMGRDYKTPGTLTAAERRGNLKGDTLPNFVEHLASLHPVQSIHDGRPLSPTGRTLRRRLNPAFACWLMGWPIWWTNPALINCARSATALWHYRLQSQLSYFFNDQE